MGSLARPRFRFERFGASTSRRQRRLKERTARPSLSDVRTIQRLYAARHPASSVLDGMRRSLATELLENTHMVIDQVAERVGFSDATSFRKAFKKWTGRSPTDFRSRHLPF